MGSAYWSAAWCAFLVEEPTFLLVVWGPSAKLLAEDEALQIHIKHMINLGVVVKACKKCSDSYGVSHKLEKIGIIVKYMQELTDYIKEGRNILTF